MPFLMTLCRPSLVFQWGIVCLTTSPWRPCSCSAVSSANLHQVPLIHCNHWPVGYLSDQTCFYLSPCGSQICDVCWWFKTFPSLSHSSSSLKICRVFFQPWDSDFRSCINKLQSLFAVFVCNLKNVAKSEKLL